MNSNDESNTIKNENVEDVKIHTFCDVSGTLVVACTFDSDHNKFSPVLEYQLGSISHDQLITAARTKLRWLKDPRNCNRFIGVLPVPSLRLQEHDLIMGTYLDANGKDII